MIFLIEYDRAKGSIVEKKSFIDSMRSKAESDRLTLELDLKRKQIEHEVVLLEAENEDALRQTHRRYFQSLSEIRDSFRDATQGSSHLGAP